MIKSVMIQMMKVESVDEFDDDDDRPWFRSEQNGKQSLASVDERSAQFPPTLSRSQRLVLLDMMVWFDDM